MLVTRGLGRPSAGLAAGGLGRFTGGGPSVGRLSARIDSGTIPTSLGLGTITVRPYTGVTMTPAYAAGSSITARPVAASAITAADVDSPAITVRPNTGTTITPA